MLGDTAPLADFVEVEAASRRLAPGRRGPLVRLFRRARPRAGRGAGSGGGYRLRGRHVQQEPGRHRRLRRVQPPAASTCCACAPAPTCSRPRPVPASMASVHAALRRIEADPGLRTQLWANARRLHAGLTNLGLRPCSAPGPVIAVPLPDEVTAAAGMEPAARARRLRQSAPCRREHPIASACCAPACPLRTRSDQIDAIVDRFAAVMATLEHAPAGAGRIRLAHDPTSGQPPEDPGRREHGMATFPWPEFDGNAGVPADLPGEIVCAPGESE